MKWFEKNYNKEKEFYEAIAKLGDAIPIRNLGHLYENVCGVE